MIELNPAQYRSILPLFKSLDYHLTIRAALSGTFPAPVFAYDPIQPHLAVIWAGKRLYIAGEDLDSQTTACLRELIHSRIYPEALARGYEVVIFYYPTEPWGSTLAEILAGKQFVKAARELYEFQGLPADWQANVPEGFHLQIIDADLLGRSKLQHLDELIAEIQNEGETVDHFLRHRFGVAATYGRDEIAGWCLSEYNLGERCEIGIETLEPYQRRGLGLAMTFALVEMALQRGFRRIGWDCYRSNLPSSATARKAGFRLEVSYEAMVCWLGREGA